MHEFLLVCVLQGGGHLLHIGDDLGEWHQAPFGIAPPQCTIGGIVHHQEGHAVLHIEIEDAHDGGMSQLGDGLGFVLEVLGLLAAQVDMQHLDGRLLIEAHVLPEVDLGIAALPQQGDQAIVAELLSDAVGHAAPPRVQ